MNIDPALILSMLANQEAVIMQQQHKIQDLQHQLNQAKDQDD